MSEISFVTKKSNCIYKLELLKTLVHFMEYDFSYFKEQCILLGREGKETSDFSLHQAANLRDLAAKSHPYIEALSKSDFSDIVIDCIIEHICSSQNIETEDLWTSCISAKDSYEKAIFKRISEYKTNRACNQWVNLMRIQEYARIKTAFVFDGEPCAVSEAKSRCRYFDLTFSVASSETGFPSDETPGVMRFSPMQMPNAVFVVSNTSKKIYKRVRDSVDSAPNPPKRQINDALRDKYALDAFDYIKDIKRPEQPEMLSAIENFRDLPDIVFMPNSFKAIIDLEIDEILNNGLMLLKCTRCGKYFERKSDYNGMLCDRVNSSGKSCREQVQQTEEELNSKTIKKKSEKLYTHMYKKIGKEIPNSEFKEWSEYLIRLRQNVDNKNATIDDLDSFLEYTEKMYGEMKE